MNLIKETKIKLHSSSHVNELIFNRLKDLGVDSINAWKTWDDHPLRTPAYYFISENLDLACSSSEDELYFTNHKYKELDIVCLFNNPTFIEPNVLYMVRPDIKSGVRYGNDMYMGGSMKPPGTLIKFSPTSNRSGDKLDLDGWWYTKEMLLDVSTSHQDVSYECIKDFPNGYEIKVGTKIPNSQMGLYPIGYFDNTEFFVKTVNIPNIKVNGYNMEVDSVNKTVNWGCRKFTFDEINTIASAFNIFSDKSLKVGVGLDNIEEVNLQLLMKINRMLK